MKSNPRTISQLQELSIREAQSIVHELQVHQIELEMQNEELRIAQKQLEDAQNKYSDLYDFAPLGYFTFDKNGSILEVNLTGAKKLGIKKGNLVNKLFFLYIAPDFKDVFYLHLRKVFNTQTQTTCELRLVDNAGGQFDALLESLPVCDSDGNITCRTAMSDITERKLMEEERIKSREMLTKAQEMGHMGSWEWDLATNDITWSEEVYAIHGLDPAMGLPKYDLILNTLAPECKNRFIKAIDDTVKLRKPFDGEYSIIQPNGISVNTHTRGEIIYDGEGHPVKMYGMVQDITERKKAEEEIVLHSEIIKNMSEGVYLMSLEDGIIHFTNPKFDEMFGYNPGEMIGKHVSIINAPTDKDPEEIARKIIDIIQKTGIWVGEIENIKKDGTHFWCFASVSVIENTKYGKVLVAVDTDITEPKKLEVLYLENERLISASKARSEFLAIMSHELRTPLTSVIGYSIILQENTHGELNEKQRLFVDNILKSSKYLLDLITNFLELAKMEAEKQIMVFEEISVPDAINEIFELIKEIAIIHDIILRKEFDPEMPHIHADKMALNQILFNLLSNAIKFSKKEGGIITVSAERENDMVKISIADTGIGIKDKDLPRLFQMFEQLDSGMSRKYEGTGLGLAITKQLVELHGGKIYVRSKPDLGSTFTFLLPIEAKKMEEE